MRFVVLGGYGMMGSVITRDLFDSNPDCEIIIAGHDLQKAKALASSFKSGRVKAVHVDVNNIDQTASALKNCDVVINAVQYYMNLNVMKAALRARCHYIDLGGLYHMTKKQLKLHDQFYGIGKVAILGCGSTPGITNIMIEYATSDMDKVSEVHIKFTDKDYTKTDSVFVPPYTMSTLFDEFTMQPAVFENGKTKLVAPMTGMEIYNFPQPFGTQQCFYSLHSEVATIPQFLKKKGIKKCTFKLGFFPDFVQKVKFLIDAGLASKEPIEVKQEGAAVPQKIVPRNAIVKVLNKLLLPEGTKVNDKEILRIDLIGKKNGKKLHKTIDCIAETQKKYNIPAGTWDTGVPPSIIAQMIARGHIWKHGVHASEYIEPKEFFQELQKRNMWIYEDGKKLKF